VGYGRYDSTLCSLQIGHISAATQIQHATSLDSPQTGL